MSTEAQALQAVLARIPYARFLGMQCELHGDEMTAILPFSDHLVGNPTLPAIHGGVLGAFLEITAIAQVSLVLKPERQPRPIGVTVQYLRSGRPLTTYARAQIRRSGRRVATVYVEAWQEARANPITSLHGHFLVSAPAQGGS